MIVLGIESSCDETAAAVVRDGRAILSSIVFSQVDAHRPYSGVVPELASRAHVERVNRVVAEALDKAKVALGPSRRGSPRRKVDAIGVTVGPGLVGALLVGRMTAEALGWATRTPVVGVNHIEGHLLSPLLEDRALRPPFLGLVVSGGHTELILAEDFGRYRLIGRTRDDAAGEAFDKVAKMMDLGYPGGPVVDRMARSGREGRSPFPRPWLAGSWDFSFSGLKTAVLYHLRTRSKWSTAQKADVCAGFQAAVVDVLVGKTLAAAEALRIKTLVVGGGVAANSRLRKELTDSASRSLRVVFASPALCTDNAAMIAAAAHFKAMREGPTASRDLKVRSQFHLPRLAASLPPFRSPRP